ncbi:hypothetical protein [Actinoallomurus sp. NPDC052274]|uniref:alpha/beta hydrolase family protein n=1 Tax=Actinoallomurus sp. NPDC052274 TaxID=3155420 RepID=UPI00343C64EE
MLFSFIRPEAEAFARAGIAALIYDKRTVGYSKVHRDYGLLADDAAAGVAALRAVPGIDPARVGLWGFSEGGWVAPLAAVRSGHVAFLVTLGASGLTPLRTQTWYLANMARHNGVTGSLDGAVTGPAARLVAGAGLFPEASYDPLPVLARLRMPVLALWGEHDIEVPPAESAGILRRALAADRSVTIGFLAGAAHDGRQTGDGFDRIGGPSIQGHRLGALAPGYTATMATWVRQVAAGHPPASSAQRPPVQAASSRAAGGHWDDNALVQAIVLAAITLTFLGCLIAGLALRRRALPRTVRRLSRWLAACGLLTVLGTVLFVLSVYLTSAQTAAPAALGRAVPWLVLQVLALATAVLTVATGTAVARGRDAILGAHRIRLIILMAAGILCVAWSARWGLLTP